MTKLLEKKNLVQICLEQCRGIHSAYSFQNIFAWKDFFEFTFEMIDAHLCIFARNATGCFQYLPPLGPGFTPATVAKCFAYMEDVNKGNGVSRIENVHDGQRPAFPENKYTFFRKGYEYCYYKKDVAALAGNAYKSKRSAYNRFVKACRHEYRSFEPGMTDECLALYDRWAQDRRDAAADDLYRHTLTENRRVHELVLRHYRELDCTGRVVFAGGRLKAYTFGYALNPDIFCVLGETADLSVKGLPVYIFTEFCRDSQLRRYSLINVMDDFEQAGLRKAKMSFRPTLLAGTYTVNKK